ncbi:FMN-linked oxidoreductase [Aspergillus ibericus CBS 121593]|uniref:FMN-linked oxidoreductase n=1 Tax=Aspergillus ibericus CBS 121593 TaxID=1448316 RepID=A0A395GU60_9EURO|nr:FMN-linked oxidoreductase [Aspergillus ibericus CBS 121593]RAK98714.1 FMN-linked oxidoreductase [Aspergillus ibericus CBS 121593]
MTITHYTDRARDGAGWIVAEVTFICPHSAEWPHAQVMYHQEHADAWAKLTSAVHDVGGKIFFQPWHAGRIQNDNMPMLKQSQYPVYAPSKIPAKGGKFRTLEGQPGHTHNITEMDHPRDIVEKFRHSVTLAKKARFDGIELLSQGGYLLHNFLCSHSNTRTDQYGGSVANRCRFPLEVLDAIIEVWGSRAVGIKIRPSDDYNDTTISYDESQPRPKEKELPDKYEPLAQFGSLYTVEEATELVKEGKIDLVTFARPFIYNPVSGYE